MTRHEPDTEEFRKKARRLCPLEPRIAIERVKHRAVHVKRPASDLTPLSVQPGNLP
jgi:hypothetical protein